MCGRYALSLRPSAVRRRLEDENMPAYEAPDDDDGTLRQTYNFAPGNHGLVYRADVPDHGAGANPKDKQDVSTANAPSDSDNTNAAGVTVDGAATPETKYKLQGMKWGLIPFWTKRQPDYGSMMRTINARDDSLAQNGGMWNTMKQRKRCIVVCEGFYEWLKKNNGREKIPHFVRRKDGQLMCFAGLWDCVKYEDREEKLYTYTVITTDSNTQLKFLHDRMPVILDNGSDAMKMWLDPARHEWSKELQSLLKPYQGELDCYPVDKAVGKVGNNSPSFVVPIDSKENKNNIANFFGNQKKQAKDHVEEKRVEEMKKEVDTEGTHIKQDPDESRGTENEIETTEDNAPLPKPEPNPDNASAKNILKHELSDGACDVEQKRPSKSQKKDVDDRPHLKSPERAPSGRKTRSATSNGSHAKPTSAAADGSKKITAFFGK